MVQRSSRSQRRWRSACAWRTRPRTSTEIEPVAWTSSILLRYLTRVVATLWSCGRRGCGAHAASRGVGPWATRVGFGDAGRNLWRVQVQLSIFSV
eukprot:6698619-Prymnesium_polylepis.1